MPQPEGPAPAPPATEVQPVLNPSDPSNPAPGQFQPHGGPDPALLSPGQPVMNPSVPINAVPYKDYPVHSYLLNAIPQTAGPEPVPPGTGIQPQNQTLPVQTVMNPSVPSNPVPNQFQSHTVQYYPPNPMPQPGQHISTYPMGGYGVPGQVPPPAGLQPQNQPPPAETVMVQSVPSNPAPHQVQSYPGHPVQINLSNPMPQSEVIGLQSVNQPPPGLPVLNQSDPSNPAPQQAQPYAAPEVPPPVLLFGVPPGLEYLTQVDQILIHQKMECIEMFTGFETNNQYEIKNSIGQKIYHAKEDSNCFTRNFFGRARDFKMHITDNMDQEVILMHRPMRCFLQEIEVQAPPGVTVGYVKQEWSCFLPKFSILGPNNEELLKIQGPFLQCKCCGDVNFEIKGMIGEQSIGQITKQRSGFLKKCISDAT
ncbi:phospholipid scramblase 2-like, partial [Onychostoma macrolepis]|uniref:phospholipid scramblase 2-like n=1 Tax=Onychostoma macrolepis TaxID=369639 RepID=UPI00272AC2E4